MNIRKMAILAGAAWVLAGTGVTMAEEAQPSGAETVKKQTICPVMGGQINPRIYADANGKRVYFCCRSCVLDFSKDPAKFISKLEKDGVTVDKTPASSEPNKPSTNAAARAQCCAPSDAKDGACCK